ncbi:NAD(P)H-dependent glycerol-3-phosphate dehydrogenase [Candidatus Dependentiae bacterium]
MKQVVTVLGSGAFGTSVAQLLADNGHTVNLWCYEKDVGLDIQNNSENKKYLPGIKLNPNINPTSELNIALQDSKCIFEAIPVKFLRKILIQAKSFLKNEQILVVLSKGIEQDTLLLPTQILDDVFDNQIKKAVMAGPNFASEIVKRFNTATLVASGDKKINQDIKKLLSNDYFKVKLSSDVIGIQVGGAIKNVICLASGFIQGFCGSRNSLAFLLTNGLQEMEKLAVCLGGKKETIYGLSGFGDLVLSATSNLSKNNRVGNLIGQGKTIDDLKKEFTTLPEGINTVVSIYDLIKKCDLDLPICKQTYKVIFEGKSIKEFLNDIFL